MSVRDELSWGFFVEIDLENENNRRSSSSLHYYYNEEGRRCSKYMNMDTIQEAETETETETEIETEVALDVMEKNEKPSVSADKNTVYAKIRRSFICMNMLLTLPYFCFMMTLMYFKFL